MRCVSSWLQFANKGRKAVHHDLGRCDCEDVLQWRKARGELTRRVSNWLGFVNTSSQTNASSASRHPDLEKHMKMHIGWNQRAVRDKSCHQLNIVFWCQELIQNSLSNCNKTWTNWAHRMFAALASYLLQTSTVTADNSMHLICTVQYVFTKFRSMDCGQSIIQCKI